MSGNKKRKPHKNQKKSQFNTENRKFEFFLCEYVRGVVEITTMNFRVFDLFHINSYIIIRLDFLTTEWSRIGFIVTKTTAFIFIYLTCKCILNVLIAMLGNYIGFLFREKSTHLKLFIWFSAH